MFKDISEAPKDGTKVLGFNATGDAAVIWWDDSYPNINGNWVYGEVEEDYINSWLTFEPVQFTAITYPVK